MYIQLSIEFSLHLSKCLNKSDPQCDIQKISSYVRARHNPQILNRSQINWTRKNALCKDVGKATNVCILTVYSVHNIAAMVSGRNVGEVRLKLIEDISNVRLLALCFNLH
jgi:hypothetical protein